MSGIYAAWALIPNQIRQGQGFETLITSAFMHGGFFHLAGNMLFLHIYGDNLEDEMGHGKFLWFYLSCALAAGLAQVMSDPLSSVPVVGASGAVAGVMGGYLLLYPRAKIDVLFIFVIFFKIFYLPAWIILWFWFALQLFNGALIPLMRQALHIGRISGDFSRASSLYSPLHAAWRTRILQATEGHPHIPKRNIACLLRAFQKSKGPQ